MGERLDAAIKSLPTKSNFCRKVTDELKVFQVANFIEEHPKEADLKWSLFCAAANSYRFDSILQPFPPLFMTDDYKEIDSLREVIKSCPPLNVLANRLKTNKASSSLLDLLYWNLIQLNEPTLKIITKEQHTNIISQVSTVMSPTMPDYIFQVIHGSQSLQKFSIMASKFSTKLAYHGSRLDNFFSILNYGLQASFSKTGAFGPGTYLSSEMGISLSYSPVGFTWSCSCFGPHISIIALCEIINHPDVRSEFDSKKSSDMNWLDLCDSQTSPKKYFIVENNDLVQIRYLLIYSTCDTEAAALMTSPTLLGWIKRHKVFTIIAAYIILLLAIGSSNSSTIYKYYRRLLK